MRLVFDKEKDEWVWKNVDDLPSQNGQDSFSPHEPYVFFAKVPRKRFAKVDQGDYLEPFFGSIDDDVELEQEQIKGLVAAARLLNEILGRPERQRGHLTDPWNMSVAHDLLMTLYGIARIRLHNLLELKRAAEEAEAALSPAAQLKPRQKQARFRAVI